ncbi:MAG: LysR family transcriptional regulator [Marinibacterium sp.]
MKLHLRQLEMIEAVAKHGSLTRAAEAMNVTQPAISIQLRKLEAEVGIALLERSGRNVHLTEAGEEVLHHAQRMTRVLDDLKDNLEQFRGVNRGSLRIAVVSTANYFIPSEIAEFRRTHPGVEVNLHVANRDMILGMLESNTADLAITGQPPDDSDLIARPFKENRLVVIAPPDHPLTKQKTVSPVQLAECPFVVREPGSGTRAVMERAFQAHGISCQISCVLSSNEAVKQAVQAGLGLAVISQQTTELEAETGRLAVLDASDLTPVRQWYIVYRNFRRLPPAALEFRNQLLETD